MRTRVAVVLIVLATAACGGGAPQATAPTAAPTSTEAAVAVAPGPVSDGATRSPYLRGPDAEATHETQFAPPALTPEDRRAMDLLTPSVAVVPAAYAVSPLQARVATAAELADLRGPVGGWTDSFVAMLDRQRHPQPGVDPGLDLRNMFTDPRLATVVLRSLSTPTGLEPPTLAAAGWTLDGAVMRAWGSPAYVDVTVRAVDHAATDLALEWRMRLQQVGFWYRVMDLREPATGEWVIGTGPRYSALELETELRNAVGWYLSGESYSSARGLGSAIGFIDAPFFRARFAAIEELNRQYAAGRFRERYFTGVSATIERFEPAWFGGDGVVTVRITGRVVETRGDGTASATSFVQQLKFLRAADAWTAIDAQNDDGSWASGGDLALAEVAKPHG